MYSNSPSNTGKLKETTKCGSLKEKARTTPRKDEQRLAWPFYTTFVHDTIVQLYVDDEEDERGEFTMTKDFYYGKVSMDDFFRVVAATVVQNVLREKEKREGEEK